MTKKCKTVLDFIFIFNYYHFNQEKVHRNFKFYTFRYLELTFIQKPNLILIWVLKTIFYQ